LAHASANYGHFCSALLGFFLAIAKLHNHKSVPKNKLMLEFKSLHSAKCTQTLILAPQNKKFGGQWSKFGRFN
jgi:hypothetical protein